MNGTVIVVGASSGIGAALGLHLAREDRRVAMLARRADALRATVVSINREVGDDRAVAFVHDAADLSRAEPRFEEIERSLGDVDELYYVAGIMPPVARDEFDTDKDRDQFLVNALGCIAWVNAAARRFASRRRGHIIGITSVAQDRGRVGRPGYCASKAGQDAFLEAVRNRLWRLGVKVTTVRPGYVDTPMTEGLGLRGAISADRAAQLILRARNRDAAVAYIPFRWRPIMAAIRSIPSFVFRRLEI